MTLISTALLGICSVACFHPASSRRRSVPESPKVQRRELMGQCLPSLFAASRDGAAASSVEVLACLWFPDAKLPCRHYITHGAACTRRNCTYSHDETTSLIRFLRYFQNAKHSIDIAVFTITCNEISDAVEECHRRGVRVRIITDDEQMKTRGSDILALHAKGIPVRHDGSHQFHMHNKFAVFDQQVVATGSFNWTRQAVLHNQENIVILSGKQVASEYEAEFERMWAQFSHNALPRV